MHATLPRLRNSDFPAIERRRPDVLQVNLGYRCNQTCLHCHVNAGPTRRERMDGALIDLVIDVLRARMIGTLDLTGGAPELHPGFRRLVIMAMRIGVRVIDRCNLSILFEPGQEGLAEFLALHKVEIAASLPCYSAANVDQQRGAGVFEKSIAALHRLNGLGYGKTQTGLVLNLVYNPQGPSLPPPQEALQARYKQELNEHFGVNFNQLFTVTNMPIKRFGSTLISKGTFDSYLQLLKDNMVAANLEHVMCRNLLSVDWRGRLYDCDFNQQLGLPVSQESGRHLRDLLEHDPAGDSIQVADHCYGCTAGQGSSCGGALQDPV